MVIGHNNPAPSKRVFVLDQQSIGATVEPPLLAVEAQRQSVLVPTRTQTTLDEREYDKDGNQELVPAENWDRANDVALQINWFQNCSKFSLFRGERSL